MTAPYKREIEENMGRKKIKKLKREHIDRWTDEHIDRWTDEHIDRWTDEHETGLATVALTVLCYFFHNLHIIRFYSIMVAYYSVVLSIICIVILLKYIFLWSALYHVYHSEDLSKWKRLFRRVSWSSVVCSCLGED
jgi:hypothetical protein